ncbi:UNVERIFIED_CONTAM: protein SCARECROW [Sesamum latifolium]|uniref:Protein SCARECROW n=1 Tax=Sesamum latifolium TaxID=2727402 RepID=A0AAW2Y0Y9_9LAMI
MQPQEQLSYPGNGFSEVSSSCKNLERNEQLSQWVENVTKQLMTEDLPESNENDFPGNFQGVMPPVYEEVGAVAALLGELRPRKVARKSSNESPGSVFLQHNHHQYYTDDDQDDQTYNLSVESSKRMISSSAKRPGPDEPGLNLLTLLLECAVAISQDNLGEAHRMLLELSQMASPYGLPVLKGWLLTSQRPC